jgi:hypothetical protein
MRTFLFALLFAPFVASAVPVDLTHTGRLLDQVGSPVSGDHTLTVSLWKHGSSVALSERLWTDTYVDVPVNDGYYNLTLSGVSSEDFASSVWVDVSLDGAAPMLPRQALTRVPAAALADTATHVPVRTFADSACSDAGAIAFDDDLDKLRFCDGAVWQVLGTVVIEETAGVKRWRDGRSAKSCEDYRRPAAPYAYLGDSGDGLYSIDPDGSGSTYGDITVYCDQTNHDGGWTLALSAGLNRDLTVAGINGTFLPYATSAANPGSGVLHKMSDTLINDIRTRGGSDIAYWMTTPGNGTGTLGAEIFYRGDCDFALRQSEASIRATTCDEWTINYSDTPSWAPGGHWWIGNSSYISAFGHGNAEILGTESVCHTDGRGLGIHNLSWAPFHRGWCSVQAWGQIWVR